MGMQLQGMKNAEGGSSGTHVGRVLVNSISMWVTTCKEQHNTTLWLYIIAQAACMEVHCNQHVRFKACNVYYEILTGEFLGAFI